MTINFSVSWTESGVLILRLRGLPSFELGQFFSLLHKKDAAEREVSVELPGDRTNQILKGPLWGESLGRIPGQSAGWEAAGESPLLARLKRAGHDISRIVDRRSRPLIADAINGQPSVAVPLPTFSLLGLRIPQWLLPLGCLVVTYVLSNFVIPKFNVAPWLGFYIVQPLPWLALGGICALFWYRIERRCFRTLSPLLHAGLLLGGVQVAILVLTGVVFGFGSSPYSHRILPLIGNIVRIAVILLSVEMVRGYLAAVFDRRDKTLALVATCLIISFVQIPSLQLSNIGSPAGVVITVGQTLLPSVSENLLASFLILTGGLWASVAYRGVLLAFEWLSPILPSGKWVLLALIQTLVPLLGLLTVQDLFDPARKLHSQKQEGASVSSQLGWLFVGLVAVFLIWFNTGALGFEPTVLSGPSMRPKIWAGDLVITKEVPVDEIQVGDIIKFDQHGRYVIHRVIRIENDKSPITFVTKGDNLADADSPISEYQVKGKVVAILPKAGYVSMWARDFIKFVKVRFIKAAF